MRPPVTFKDFFSSSRCCLLEPWFGFIPSSPKVFTRIKDNKVQKDVGDLVALQRNGVLIAIKKLVAFKGQSCCKVCSDLKIGAFLVLLLSKTSISARILLPRGPARCFWLEVAREVEIPPNAKTNLRQHYLQIKPGP